MAQGCGFGFRGTSPKSPYAGRGRGGLPRCWHPGLWSGNYQAPGASTYPPAVTKAEEIDFLSQDAENMRRDLGEIEARIKELEERGK